MFGFLLVAQAVASINRYFKEEVTEDDFWEVPPEVYAKLQDEERNSTWLMVNPKKLKAPYERGAEIFILSEEEKGSMLSGFALLRKASETLPEDATLQERLLLARNYLPSVLFDSKGPTEAPTEECKILPFQSPLLERSSLLEEQK